MAPAKRRQKAGDCGMSIDCVLPETALLTVQLDPKALPFMAGPMRLEELASPLAGEFSVIWDPREHRVIRGTPEALASQDQPYVGETTLLARIRRRDIAERLVPELTRYAVTRGYADPHLEVPVLDSLLKTGGWYAVLVVVRDRSEISMEWTPSTDELFDMAFDVLSQYLDRYWAEQRRAYERSHLLITEWPGDSLPTRYRLSPVNKRSSGAKSPAVPADAGTEPERRDFERLTFPWHLYNPLLVAAGPNTLRASPPLLGPEERAFLLALHQSHERLQTAFPATVLWAVRLAGLAPEAQGFRTATFRPDLILWLVSEDRQCVTFIEMPKQGEPEAKPAGTDRSAPYRLRAFRLQRSPASPSAHESRPPALDTVIGDDEGEFTLDTLDSTLDTLCREIDADWDRMARVISGLGKLPQRRFPAPLEPWLREKLSWTLDECAHILHGLEPPRALYTGGTLSPLATSFFVSDDVARFRETLHRAQLAGQLPTEERNGRVFVTPAAVVRLLTDHPALAKTVSPHVLDALKCHCLTQQRALSKLPTQPFPTADKSTDRKQDRQEAELKRFCETLYQTDKFKKVGGNSPHILERNKRIIEYAYRQLWIEKKEKSQKAISNNFLKEYREIYKIKHASIEKVLRAVWPQLTDRSWYENT